MLKHLWTSQSLVLPQFCNSVCKLVMQPQFHTGVAATRSAATRNLEQQKIGGSAEKKGGGELVHSHPYPQVEGWMVITGRQLCTRALLECFCVCTGIVGWLQTKMPPEQREGSTGGVGFRKQPWLWEQPAGNHFSWEWPCSDQVLSSLALFEP